MRLMKFKLCALQSVPFANHFVILLMSRWRAITSSKYVSIDASIISTYLLSVAPLVETRKKRTFPSITTEKCPIHINIFVAYLLHSM